MSCSSKSKTWGPIPVWTNKTTTTWLFHPLSGPMDSTDINKIRASFELRQSSGALLMAPALRMGNDGLTWDSAVQIGTDTSSNEGVTYGAAFIDMHTTTQAKVLVQFGVLCKNTTGAIVEQAMAALKIDWSV